MAKKKDDASLRLLLMVAAFIVFLPFLIFSLLRYQQLKRHYRMMPNIQRVSDVGKLYSSLFGALLTIAVAIGLMAGLIFFSQEKTHAESATGITAILAVCIPVLMIYPMKKMAERVATEYFGIIFNDNDNTMIFPADIRNIGLGDILSLRFLTRLGDRDCIEIGKITNVTREKGVNFYIHGEFGSRLIHFSTKQKRDECLSALQVRTRIRGSRR